MKIDVYQAITVDFSYNYDETDDDGNVGRQYTVVSMGDVEVHRTPSKMYYGYGEDKDYYEQQEKDRAVGEFAKKLLSAINGGVAPRTYG